MTRRLLVLVAFGALLGAGVKVAAPAQANLGAALETIASSGGRYRAGGASLAGADCSGLVSVAQSLAMGQAPHRLGSTTSLLAGRWPGAIRGATPADVFVIGTTRGHMVARIDGVNIESRSRGERFRIGDDAASPFDSRFTLYHIDESLLVA